MVDNLSFSLALGADTDGVSYAEEPARLLAHAALAVAGGAGFDVRGILGAASAAVRAGTGALQRDFLIAAGGNFFQGEFDAGADVTATQDALLGLPAAEAAEPAKAASEIEAEASAEDIAQEVVDVHSSEVQRCLC